jgi:hypothetical protein
MFIIIPGMEFVLPFAVKAFPNMLPSTFRETLKTQEDKKRLLRARIEMTTFFQSTMRDFAEESKSKARVRQQKIKQRVKDTKMAREQVAEEGGEEVEEGDMVEMEEQQEKVTLELNRASRLMDSIDKVCFIFFRFSLFSR